MVMRPGLLLLAAYQYGVTVITMTIDQDWGVRNRPIVRPWIIRAGAGMPETTQVAQETSDGVRVLAVYLNYARTK